MTRGDRAGCAGKSAVPGAALIGGQVGADSCWEQVNVFSFVATGSLLSCC